MNFVRACVLVALGIAIGAWTLSPSAPSDLVTVCRAMCTPMEYDFWECEMKGGKLNPVGSTRFKVSIADQTVFEEREFGGPYKFTSCKVMDNDNWSCAYNDKSGEIGMGKGKYYEVFGQGSEDLQNYRTVKATGQVPCSKNDTYLLRDLISQFAFWRK